MDWFNVFLDKVEFIRPTYMVPFFIAISTFISSILTPLSGDNFYHEFKKPEETVYAGETLEITSDYVIVTGENASAAEKNAAQKLKEYLFQINGTDLAIVSDTAAEADKEIIIGKTNREGDKYTVDRTALGDDGIVIKTINDKLILSGAEKRGALYAVYNFLEEYFDCHWFTYDLTVIPEREKLLIPADIDYSYTPKLSFRITDWQSPSRSVEYKIANGLNGDTYGHIPEEYGSGISYAGQFCHTFASLVDTALFAEKPEVFALGVESGERTVNQLCLTNPETLELTKKTVRRWLDSNPNSTIISVTQNDNQDYCVCENCKKIDDEEGSHAGTMLRFVNAIADDIKEDYPDVMVDTFAYQYTRTPPSVTVPRDNVIVRLCSIECKFSTPLNSGCCPENEKFVQDIKGWSRICKNLHVWDYTTNYSHYLAPFANFDILAENIKFFAENNVIGLYEEGNYSSIESDGEFAELRCYMLSKLMWNPELDVDKLMYDFCEAYYGDGAQGIVDFINYIDKNSGGIAVDIKNWWITPFPNEIKVSVGTEIFSSVKSAVTLRVKESDIEKIDAMWSFAKNGAKDALQKENVERSEICWRYWKACRTVGEFSYRNENRLAENQKLYDDMMRLGIIRICEWDDGYISANPDLSQTPDRWNR